MDSRDERKHKGEREMQQRSQAELKPGTLWFIKPHGQPLTETFYVGVSFLVF